MVTPSRGSARGRSRVRDGHRGRRGRRRGRRPPRAAPLPCAPATRDRCWRRRRDAPAGASAPAAFVPSMATKEVLTATASRWTPPGVNEEGVRWLPLVVPPHAEQRIHISDERLKFDHGSAPTIGTVIDQCRGGRPPTKHRQRPFDERCRCSCKRSRSTSGPAWRGQSPLLSPGHATDRSSPPKA